jgi:hypothetical protein
MYLHLTYRPIVWYRSKCYSNWFYVGICLPTDISPYTWKHQWDIGKVSPLSHLS